MMCQRAHGLSFYALSGERRTSFFWSELSGDEIQVPAGRDSVSL